MKFHRRIIATGNEWQPCIECQQRFEAGEVLSAVDTESNAGVLYWFCEECTERLFGFLLRQGWRGTWRIRKADGSREPVDWNQAG
jgi:hypothetical protein